MSLPYFKFYAGDYLRDTYSLSPAEHGCYLLLLIATYSGQEIPEDLGSVYSICSARTEQEQACAQRVLTRFFDLEDGRWVNARAEKELAAAGQVSEGRRKGGRARAQQMLSKRSANGEHKLSTSSPNAEHEQSNSSAEAQLELSECTTGSGSGSKGGVGENEVVTYSPEFLDWWRVFPRKDAKEAAWKAWKKLKLSSELLSDIMTATYALAESPSSREANGKFVPHGATWINGRRWNDPRPFDPNRNDDGSPRLAI